MENCNLGRNEYNSDAVTGTVSGRLKENIMKERNARYLFSAIYGSIADRTAVCGRDRI